jgi:hypothetical protein
MIRPVASQTPPVHAGPPTCALMSATTLMLLLARAHVLTSTEAALEITSGPSLLWANVGQLQRVTVRGTGFVVGSPLMCRVVDAPYDGSNFCPYCRSPAEVPRPAHVINATAASCWVAGSASGILSGGGTSPGYAAGSGMLQFNDSSKYGWPRNTAPWSWPLDFQPLVDVAVGRRPYYSNETDAELVVMLGAAVSQPVQICALLQQLSPHHQPVALPCATVHPTVDGRGTAVPFSLRTLPPTFNGTVAVNFSTTDGKWQSGVPIVRRLVVRAFCIAHVHTAWLTERPADVLDVC